MESFIIRYLIIDAFLALIICMLFPKLKVKSDRAYWVQALVALGMAGYQAYQSHQQKKAANNLKPSNYVPPSVKEAVANARLNSNTTQLPGAGTAYNRLKTSSANTISRAKEASNSPASVQQAVASTDAREKETIKDLGVASENFRLENKDRLTNLLGVQGGYEKASQDAYNATKSALLGASKQNMYNAISGVAENSDVLLDDLGIKNSGSSLNTINGKTGEALSKALARARDSGRALSDVEKAYLEKMGYKPGRTE